MEHRIEELVTLKTIAETLNPKERMKSTRLGNFQPIILRIFQSVLTNRSGSTSTRLAKYIVAEFRRQGVQADLYDLHRDPVPFYSPDEAQDDHAGLLRLKRMAADADGFVLASPEYHGSISGVLKNALDHLGKEHFTGKPVLSATSSGGPVGISSLLQLQAMVRNLHGVNCPEWISIGGEQRKLFETDPEGYLPEHAVLDRIHNALHGFLDLLRRVRGQAG